MLNIKVDWFDKEDGRHNSFAAMVNGEIYIVDLPGDHGEQTESKMIHVLGIVLGARKELDDPVYNKQTPTRVIRAGYLWGWEKDLGLKGTLFDYPTFNGITEMYYEKQEYVDRYLQELLNEFESNEQSTTENKEGV